MAQLTGATFTDANPGDNSADFTATITWGDGHTSTGTVSYDSTTQTYSVDGSHTYAEEGSDRISISVVDDGGSTTTITGSATVAEPQIILTNDAQVAIDSSSTDQGIVLNGTASVLANDTGAEIAIHCQRH